MVKKLFVLLTLMTLTASTAMAAEVAQSDFEVKSTQALVNLCTASAEDPLFVHAVNFCHGYLVGAYHYYEASVAGEGAQRFVCPPEARPSRNEIIAMFVKWAKDHPQYLKELPVETEFRFLSEKWPCK